MSGEHLPLSNYDELSEKEIKHKLAVLQAGGSLNVEVLREHEKDNQNRKGIVSYLDKLEQGEVETPEEAIAPSPSAVPQTESKAGPTPGSSDNK